jgi:DNA-binding response OmpR family regulator
LVVSDTGTGMDAETQARVFEPFFTTKELGKGTGLGLSSVYGIVRQCSGHIDLESEPGRGTTFRICFPVTGKEQRPEPAALGAAARPAARRRVLIVEDEPLVRMTVVHYLNEAGYEVFEADSETQALEVARREQLDALITDIMLPGASGAQIAAKIASLRPGLATVYVSAHPRELLICEWRIPQSAVSLQKPFSEYELLAAVEAAFISGQPQSAVADLPSERALSVLLVEDYPPARRATEALLGEAGFLVQSAARGVDALCLAQNSVRPFDVVVTDIGLPDRSGFDVARALRADRPELGVVFVSGRAPDDPELKTALTAPRTSFIRKPIDFDALAEAIYELFVRGESPEHPPGNGSGLARSGA